MSLKALCDLAGKTGDNEAPDRIRDLMVSFCNSRELRDILAKIILLLRPEPWVLLDRDKESGSLIVRYGVDLDGASKFGGITGLTEGKTTLLELIKDEFNDGYIDEVVSGVESLDDKERIFVEKLRSDIQEIVDFLDRALSRGRKKVT